MQRNSIVNIVKKQFFRDITMKINVGNNKIVMLFCLISSVLFASDGFFDFDPCVYQHGQKKFNMKQLQKNSKALQDIRDLLNSQRYYSKNQKRRHLRRLKNRFAIPREELLDHIEEEDFARDQIIDGEVIDNEVESAEPQVGGDIIISLPVYDDYNLLWATQRRINVAIRQSRAHRLLAGLRLYDRMHMTLLYTRRTSDQDLEAIKDAVQDSKREFEEAENCPVPCFGIRIGGLLQLFGSEKVPGKMFLGVPAAMLDEKGFGFVNMITRRLPFPVNKLCNLHVSIGEVKVENNNQVRLLRQCVHESNIFSEPYVYGNRKIMVMPSQGRRDITYLMCERTAPVQPIEQPAQITYQDSEASTVWDN